MARRYKFKKIFSGEPGRCLFCGKYNTLFALLDEKDGSECPACVECAVIKSKGRASGIRKYVGRKALRTLAMKIPENSLIKNAEMPIIQTGGGNGN